MDDKEYSALECALQSIVWYNGLDEDLLEWKKATPKSVYNPMLQVFWMIAVCLFGDYGTSPRSGWINDIEGFHKYIDDMCYKCLKAKEDINNDKF